MYKVIIVTYIDKYATSTFYYGSASIVIGNA